MNQSAKILVTGANGFVGQALCRRLIHLGYSVFGLDRNSPVIAGLTHFYQQDITQSFTLKEDFDFVFHLAAYNVTHVGQQSAHQYQMVNVLGTQNVVAAVKTAHFVLLSTTKVYLAQGKIIDEDAPLLPLQEYEKSKLAAEEVCRKELDNRSLVILRCVNIVGAGQPEKAVIPVLFKKAKAGETLEIFGPRSTVLQFLFVEDVVDAFVHLIEKNNVSGVYNLAGSQHIRLDELAFQIKEICHSNSEIHYNNEDLVEFSQVSSAKAEKALHWQAKTSIQEILASYQSP
ncbi:MAG: NAD(P)-dependent oxidoreductase [Candidatus Omnitrophica bacterium]|nr:NAD(P)-dependent oxidoreductase [Candidatus Omnitrophota bacterium]